MNQFILYHNPRCSKSRQALEILQNHGIHPVIIEYLKTPLSLEQITQLRSHFDCATRSCTEKLSAFAKEAAQTVYATKRR